MIESNFKDWTLDSLDKTFGMKQILEEECSLLQKWEKLAQKQEVSEIENINLLKLQKPLKWGGKAWNEFELENKFISPVIMEVQFDDRKIGYFLERPLQGTVGDYKLKGIVDGMIATGFRSPDIPFFCMYKAPRSPKGKIEESPPLWGVSGAVGMPDAQALAAMMVAREMNANKKPIYGMYIVGLIWNFMVLNGTEYCISKDYKSDDEEIFDVFRMLKALKIIIKTELM